MGIFSKQNIEKKARIQIFAVGKQGNYKNLFTIIRVLESSDTKGNIWIKRQSKNNFRLFECYVTTSEGIDFFHKIKEERNVTIPYQEKDITIEFGEMLARQPIFIPNISETSLARNWWPGSLKEGFRFCMLYGNSEIEIGEKAKENAFEFVKKMANVNLYYLQDLIGTVLCIHDQDLPLITFQFNPDKMLQVFALHGDQIPQKRRVIIQAWESEETLESQMFDLTEENPFCIMPLPFSPIKTGYELYEWKDASWKIVKKHSSYLMRKIHIGMNMTVGKLIVKKEDTEEEHNITVRQNPIVVGETDEEQPWVVAELQRTKRNKGIEIRQLASIFLPYQGQESNQIWKDLIYQEILQKASKRLWIWDPYLDGSILDPIYILGLSRRGLDIRLLLSEWLGEKVKKVTEADTKPSRKNLTANGALAFLPRCSSIANYFEQRMKETPSLPNIEIRNWFRSGSHSFHDRFIIVDDAVWHVGSSIKDIGNYHSTIYRLEGDLPKQVIKEFEKGWDGHFSNMQPTGFKVFPDCQWIEGDTNE